MRRRPSLRVVALLAGVGLVAGAAGGITYAAFSSITSNAGNTFSTATDWTPPTVSGSVIAKTTGYLAGAIRQGGSYYVYANASDAGSPPSGVATVTANVSTVTTGATAVALTAGSYSVQGVTYGYRSASLTANNPLAAGPKTYSVTATDAAANTTTQGGFSVNVDNTVPAGTDVQTANGGATVGRAETGDTITFTFSEQIDPESILAGWTGTSTTVTVRLRNNAGGDRVQIWNAANATQLPFNFVNLGRTDYTNANRNFTNSTMVQSGSVITLTLGTPSGAVRTALGNGTMSWTPSATPYDAAGNASSTAAVTESGAADPEF